MSKVNRDEPTEVTDFFEFLDSISDEDMERLENDETNLEDLFKEFDRILDKPIYK